MTYLYSQKKRHLKKQYNLKIKKRKDKPLTVHPDEIIAER
jgi:hypothetical protein